MTKILMVCLGNICRSPLAEGILKSKLTDTDFIVDSAGTSNYHIGDVPDKRSIKVANEHNIDISNQRGRQFTLKDFDEFDYIYVMDSSNYKNLVKLARNSQDISKVKLILNELEPNKNFEVPDPYYGGVNGFEQVYNLLNNACNIISQKIK